MARVNESSLPRWTGGDAGGGSRLRSAIARVKESSLSRLSDGGSGPEGKVGIALSDGGMGTASDVEAIVRSMR